MPNIGTVRHAVRRKARTYKCPVTRSADPFAMSSLRRCRSHSPPVPSKGYRTRQRIIPRSVPIFVIVFHKIVYNKVHMGSTVADLECISLRTSRDQHPPKWQPDNESKKPVKTASPPKLIEDLADRIHSKIVSGEYPPGTHL